MPRCYVLAKARGDDTQKRQLAERKVKWHRWGGERMKWERARPFGYGVAEVMCWMILARLNPSEARWPRALVRSAARSITRK